MGAGFLQMILTQGTKSQPNGHNLVTGRVQVIDLKQTKQSSIPAVPPNKQGLPAFLGSPFLFVLSGYTQGRCTQAITFLPDDETVVQYSDNGRFIKTTPPSTIWHGV